MSQYRYLDELFLEIEKHAILRAHATLVYNAWEEKNRLMTHQYVWVGNEPYYEKDVVEILRKYSNLREEVDKLRVRLAKLEKEKDGK